jgi:hypothetical protein
LNHRAIFFPSKGAKIVSADIIELRPGKASFPLALQRSECNRAAGISEVAAIARDIAAVQAEIERAGRMAGAETSRIMYRFKLEEELAQAEPTSIADVVTKLRLVEDNGGASESASIRQCIALLEELDARGGGAVAL